MSEDLETRTRRLQEATEAHATAQRQQQENVDNVIAAEEELQTAQTRLAEAEQNLTQALDELAANERQVRSLTESITEKTQEKAPVDSEIKRLEALQNLVTAYEEATALSQAADNRYSNVSEELARATQTLETAVAKVSDLETALQEAQNAETEFAAVTIEALLAGTAATTIPEITTALENLRSAVEKVEQAQEKQRIASEAVSTHETRVAKLETDYQRLAEAVNTARAEIERLRNAGSDPVTEYRYSCVKAETLTLPELPTYSGPFGENVPQVSENSVYDMNLQKVPSGKVNYPAVIQRPEKQLPDTGSNVAKLTLLSFLTGTVGLWASRNRKRAEDKITR